MVNHFSLPIISDITLLFDKNGFYPVQTGFYPTQTGFYPAQTGFIRYSSVITDYTVNITVISYFNYYLGNVPRTATTPTTTAIFLGPRCFATRGQKDFNEKTFLVNESQENVVISSKIHVLKYSSFSIFKTVSWEGSPLSSRPCKVLMENSVTFLNVCRKVTWMKWVISICFIIQTTKHSSSIIIFFFKVATSIWLLSIWFVSSNVHRHTD